MTLNGRRHPRRRRPRRPERAFDSPDNADVVSHSYHHRLGAADGYAPSADVERRLARLPAVTVPAITLDGAAHGVVAATDGRAQASRFTAAFADAVWKPGPRQR